MGRVLKKVRDSLLLKQQKLLVFDNADNVDSD